MSLNQRVRPAEVGLQKLFLFPEKLAALQQSARGGPDLSYPVSVELSLTNRCNQNCRWCSDKKLRGRAPDRMDMSVLRKLFTDLAAGGTRGITIEGGGEPTLADFFEDAVLAARGEGLAVGLISNGLAMFSAGRNPAVYKNFEWIRLSLDAADPDQYLSLKGVDGFEQSLANLGRLAELAPDSVLGVGYVLTRHNDAPDQLRKLAVKLARLGADYLHIRPVVDHPELASSQNLDFLKKYESAKFSINIAALTDNAPSGNNGLPCLAHSLSTVIGADGNVWLCGRLNTEESARSIGNVLDSSFRKIWLGPERAAQSAQVRGGEFCQSHCPQCRMSKYNQVLADIDGLKTKNFI